MPIEGLARYSVHLTATALYKLFHHFLYMLDPQWGRVGVNRNRPKFSHNKFSVCPEKVGKMAFLGADMLGRLAFRWVS